MTIRTVEPFGLAKTLNQRAQNVIIDNPKTDEAFLFVQNQMIPAYQKAELKFYVNSRRLTEDVFGDTRDKARLKSLEAIRDMKAAQIALETKIGLLDAGEKDKLITALNNCGTLTSLGRIMRPSGSGQKSTTVVIPAEKGISVTLQNDIHHALGTNVKLPKPSPTSITKA